MTPLTACTVVTLSRLAHARVLARSFLEHHPDGRMVGLLVDDVRGEIGEDEPFELLRPGEAGLDRAELLRQAALYDALALSCALKPIAVRHLLDEGAAEVLYLDADIRVFAPLDRLTELAREHSLVLVPHLSEAPAHFDDAELSNLIAGTFNAGCMAVGAAARPFLDWWGERVARHSIRGTEGFFHDQRWLGLVPGYFDHVVLKEREFHFGFVKDPDRHLEDRDGSYYVDGRPLRTFHYGGHFDAESPWRPHPHIWLEPGPLRAISEAYASELIAAGYRRWVRAPYGYDVPAYTPQLRALYREALLLHELEEGPEPPNPLEGGPEAFASWLARAPAPAPARPPGRPRLVWEGLQDVAFGMANVNRELCRELARSDELELAVVATESGAAPPPGRADVHVRHEWPPHWDPPDAGRWVLMQPWEFGSLPRSWLEPLRLVDEVWVPSTYVRDCFVSSGVDPAKVVVVPNGVDPRRFHPGAEPLPLPTRKSFRFLFVGGTIPRKGADLLLETYLDTFGPEDDVCLVVKDLGVRSFYAGQGLRERILQAQLDPAAPELVYYDRVFAEEEVPGLYTACDCLVQPYRGEGFALPVAEAMACGLPVVVTGAGACLDYCDEEVAYLLPAEPVELAPVVGDLDTVGPVRMVEPDREALGALLRHVVAEQEEARERGRRAAERVRERLTWGAAAAVVEQRVRELAARRRRLSVCMIVRDEEALLPRALESVRGVADQLVVVDTGSTDGTVEIARSFGAEVHRFEWRDDFAAARNESLRHATGDWILVLDGDQELEAGSHDELRRLVAGGAPRAYVLRQLNYVESDGIVDVYEHLALRLFRNHPGVRFAGAVHEQLVCDAAAARFEIHPCGVVLHHHGYRPEHADPVTLERDRAALEAAAAAQPGEPFHAFNLGSTYRALGLPAEAERELLRAIALSAPALAGGTYPHYVVSSYLALAQLRLEEGLPGEAAAFCERGLALRPDLADLHLTLGVALARSGRLVEARAAYERALASAGAAAHSPTDRAAGGWRALLGLAEVLVLLGEHEEAEARFAEAEALSPQNPVVIGARERLATTRR
jgi:glycosyltransferase involved in cell wall biosynthesis